MPSSRRQVLTTAGAALLGGCNSVRRFTSDNQGTPPAPFLTEPGDWEHPDYDSANTNAQPEYAAPETIAETPGWTVEFTASDIDYVTRAIVADRIAYLAFAGVDRSEEFERLVAVDTRTSEVRWQREVRGSAFAYPPTVAGDTVLWLASADTVHALNPADGSVRWRHMGVNHVVPLAAHGLVLTVGGTHTEPVLEALDPHTGTPYWTRDESGRNWTLVAADDEAFYVTLRADTGEQQSRLHAIDPNTGESLWATSRVTPRTASLNSSYLFASTGPPDAQELVALDTATQNAKWTDTRDLQREMSDGVVNGKQSIAAVTDDRVLVYHEFHGFDQNRIEARDADSGDVVWSVTGLGDEPVPYGRPVIVGDRVYFVSRQNDTGEQSMSVLSIRNLQDGSEQTRVELAESESGELTVANNQLFFTTVSSHNTVRLTVQKKMR